MSSAAVRGAVGLHITRHTGLNRKSGQGARETRDQPEASSRPEGGAARSRRAVHAAHNLRRAGFTSVTTDNGVLEQASAEASLQRHRTDPDVEGDVLIKYVWKLY